MIPDLTIKKRDAGKVIGGQFKDANGVAVSCTGNTSRKIMMRKLGASTLKINSIFSFADAGAATAGQWTYTLLAADVDTKGYFLLECECVLPGPQTATFPTDADKPYLVVLIQDDLG